MLFTCSSSHLLYFCSLNQEQRICGSLNHIVLIPTLLLLSILFWTCNPTTLTIQDKNNTLKVKIFPETCIVIVPVASFLSFFLELRWCNIIPIQQKQYLAKTIKLNHFLVIQVVNYMGFFFSRCYRTKDGECSSIGKHVFVSVWTETVNITDGVLCKISN